MLVIIICFVGDDVQDDWYDAIEYYLSCPGLPAKRNEVVYECCPEPYLDITFTINIRFVCLFYWRTCLFTCLFIFECRPEPFLDITFTINIRSVKGEDRQFLTDLNLANFQEAIFTKWSLTDCWVISEWALGAIWVCPELHQVVICDTGVGLSENIKKWHTMAQRAPCSANKEASTRQNW